MRAARSARDRALLTLLWRCGQRIGDWSDEHGRDGVLGMRLGDLDRALSTIVVPLKGALIHLPPECPSLGCGHQRRPLVPGSSERYQRHDR